MIEAKMAASEISVVPIRKPKKSWRYSSMMSGQGYPHWRRISGTEATRTASFRRRLTGTESLSLLS